jgi:hypothetical protein
MGMGMGDGAPPLSTAHQAVLDGPYICLASGDSLNRKVFFCLSMGRRQYEDTQD